MFKLNWILTECEKVNNRNMVDNKKGYSIYSNNAVMIAHYPV